MFARLAVSKVALMAKHAGIVCAPVEFVNPISYTSPLAPLFFGNKQRCSPAIL